MSRQEHEERFLHGLEFTKIAEPVAAPPSPVELPGVAPRLVTERNLFSNVDTHPVVFDFALLKAFGAEWFQWLSDTLFREVELTFRTSISEVCRHKILAVRALHTSTMAWEEWQVFEKVICALNGVVPLEAVMQPPDVPMLMTGVDIINELRREEYSDEVARYGAACFLHDQVQYAPPPCTFMQPYISNPRYRCKDCHREGSALPPFAGYCPTCSHMFQTEHPLSLKPDEERIKEGFGQNLEYRLELDPDPVKRRFEQLDSMPGDSVAGALREEADDIQSAKLIMAVDYMKLRRQQLAEQLTGLRGWLESA